LIFPSSHFFQNKLCTGLINARGIALEISPISFAVQKHETKLKNKNKKQPNSVVMGAARYFSSLHGNTSHDKNQLTGFWPSHKSGRVISIRNQSCRSAQTVKHNKK
jgi:hypothetical protein